MGLRPSGTNVVILCTESFVSQSIMMHAWDLEHRFTSNRIFIIWTGCFGFAERVSMYHSSLLYRAGHQISASKATSNLAIHIPCSATGEFMVPDSTSPSQQRRNSQHLSDMQDGSLLSLTKQDGCLLSLTQDCFLSRATVFSIQSNKWCSAASTGQCAQRQGHRITCLVSSQCKATVLCILHSSSSSASLQSEEPMGQS